MILTTQIFVPNTFGTWRELYDAVVTRALAFAREATHEERTGRYKEAFLLREQAHRDFLFAAQLRVMNKRKAL